MKKNKNIEILVVEHKPSYVPANKLLKPIQVGTEIATKKLEGATYYDNKGDNISDKNKSYCELTAIYWAWKNLNADYYGLFHYRRYLSFSSEQDENNFAGQAYASIEAAEPYIGLDEATMRPIIEQHDLIIPRKDDTKSATNDKSIYDQYAREHYGSDLDVCLDYITKKYPEIAKYNSALDRSDGYFCNMFIMTKALFNEYCSFMFDVLAHFDESVDISQYSVMQYRVDGFLAERLTNIFIYYLQGQNKYKIKELQIAYFQNTDPHSVLTPQAAADKNVSIVLAANDYYIPYISTLLHSVANNSSANHVYDITIFHRDITAESISLLRSEFSNLERIKIRFYDISSRYDEYKNLFTRGHFAIETYFRLFIQDIMLEYDKVLYLDGDMIVNHDVAKLFETDINDYLLAAALDPDTAGLYNGFEPQKKNYMDNILKIEKPYEYFQAGVILFNLKEMRRTLNVKDLITFASSYNWELLDQDVLNYIAQGKTKYVDMSWNVMYDWRKIRLTQIVSLAPRDLNMAYIKARSHPHIVHYAGPEKPWHEPDCDFGTLYWQVARQSIFYELIIARMTDWRAGHQINRAKRRLPKPNSRTLIHYMRRTADRIAPKGTPLRVPITLTSRTIKRIIR